MFEKLKFFLQTQKKVVGMAVVLLIAAAVPLTVFIAQQQQTIQQKAAEITQPINLTTTSDSEKTLQELNKQVITNVLQYSSVTKKADGPQALSATEPIEKILKERKEVILKMVKDQPQEVTKYALPQKLRDSLPENLQPLVEKEVEVKGTLNYIHVHDFEKKTVTNIYTLTKPDNGETTYNVHFPDQNSTQNINSLSTKVVVEGMSIDNELLVNELNVQGDRLLAAPVVSGPRKVLIVPVYFTDTTPALLSKEHIKTDFFKYVDKYFREISYNKLWFEADIVDWIQLPVSIQSDYYTFYNSITSYLAPKLINENKLNLDEDVTLIIVKKEFEFSSAAIFDLMSSEGKRKELKVAIGYLGPSIDNSVTLHEVGHTLGTDHASGIFCGNDVISPRCEAVPYADQIDVMGGGGPVHMNAVTKHLFGWLEPLKISRSGEYKIEPIETNTQGTKAIQLPRGHNDLTYLRSNGSVCCTNNDIGEDNLYLEYRQPIGFDRNIYPFISTNIYNGLLIHTTTANHYRVFPTLLNTSPPKPANKAFADNPALTIGKSFTDPASGTKITVKSKDETGITLDIALGSRTDFTPPQVSITSPLPNQEVSEIVEIITNASDESSGISRVEFYAKGNPNTATDYILIGVAQNPPYKITFDFSKMPTRNYYWIYAKAYDKAGEPFNYPGNVAITPEIRIHTTASSLPSIKIISPTEGSIVTNPATFSAEVTDKDGITEFYFQVTNPSVISVFLRPPTLNSPFTVSKELLPNLYWYNVIACDRYFNCATSDRINFSVVSPPRLPPCEIYGDVNLDRKTTTEDTAIISDVISGRLKLEHSQTTDNTYISTVGDVNGDTAITTDDGALISNFVANNNTVYPVCQKAKLSPCNGLGDVTTDGKITPLDGYEALRIIVGKTSLPNLQPYTAEQIRRADVDGDGQVTSLDSLLIKRYFEGMDTTFSGCNTPTQASPRNTDTQNSAAQKPETALCTACSADINKDGRVSSVDYSLMTTCYDKAPTGTCANADIDESGTVDMTDFVCVTTHFGQSCQR